MRNLGIALLGLIILLIGVMLGISSASARPWTCKDKPNHPKCQTGTTTTTPPTTTTTPPNPANNDDLPFDIRAAFTYHWYPENWSDCHIVCGSWSEPAVGRYAFSYDKVRMDIDDLQRAKVQVGIASWHDQGSLTDQRFQTQLDAARDDGGNFQWTIYYEPEGTVVNGINNDPTATQIKADLDYIRSKYANHPNFLWKFGKPVIFVYTNNDNGTCNIVDRWRQATNNWQDWYVSPQVFPNYTSCTLGPQVWHQYAVDQTYWETPWDATTIGPGVHLMYEQNPRVPRSMSRWCDHIRRQVASSDSWQLIISWNEWGEDTQIESGTNNEVGFYGYAYIDALGRNGANC